MWHVLLADLSTLYLYNKYRYYTLSSNRFKIKPSIIKRNSNNNQIPTTKKYSYHLFTIHSNSAKLLTAQWFKVIKCL